MAQLTPVELEDGTVIFIEATEDINAPSAIALPHSSIEEDSDEEETTRTAKGLRDTLSRGYSGVRVNSQEEMAQSFKAIEGTIRAYTHYTLNAFKKVAVANINKVTLEFGIKVAGEAGVPYVTKGTAESNLKIVVECSFPEQKPD